MKTDDLFWFVICAAGVVLGGGGTLIYLVASILKELRFMKRNRV